MSNVQDFPGIRIGPEPTTDRFIAVMHADQDGVIPGNALVGEDLLLATYYLCHPGC